MHQLSAVFYFILQYSLSMHTGLKWEMKVYLSALSFFAGSGTIIPDPDPGKSSRSMRIRIHNTEKNYGTWAYGMGSPLTGSRKGEAVAQL